jgi:hypothetical protein
MNKQHIVKIKESLLFLSICRDTLCEIYDNKELQYFLKNEATDYQIIHIINNEEIPEEKYNLKKESRQWDIFQHIIKEKFELFVEMGPISPYGLSSCKPINEFLNEVSGDQGSYEQGLYTKMKTALKTVKTDIAKEKSAEANAKADLNKVAVGTTAGAAASVIKFTAAKLYKDYLAKAGQACNGRADKVTCINQFKERALTMRIAKIRSGISTCNKAKNADACKKSLHKHLTKLQKRTNK